MLLIFSHNSILHGKSTRELSFGNSGKIVFEDQKYPEYARQHQIQRTALHSALLFFVENRIRCKRSEMREQGGNTGTLLSRIGVENFFSRCLMYKQRSTGNGVACLRTTSSSVSLSVQLIRRSCAKSANTRRRRDSSFLRRVVLRVCSFCSSWRVDPREISSKLSPSNSKRNFCGIRRKHD